jgi:hypothetical protein
VAVAQCREHIFLRHPSASPQDKHATTDITKNLSHISFAYPAFGVHCPKCSVESLFSSPVYDRSHLSLRISPNCDSYSETCYSTPSNQAANTRFWH